MIRHADASDAPVRGCAHEVLGGAVGRTGSAEPSARGLPGPRLGDLLAWRLGARPELAKLVRFLGALPAIILLATGAFLGVLAYALYFVSYFFGG